MQFSFLRLGLFLSVSLMAQAGYSFDIKEGRWEETVTRHAITSQDSLDAVTKSVPPTQAESTIASIKATAEKGTTMTNIVIITRDAINRGNVVAPDGCQREMTSSSSKLDVRQNCGNQGDIVSTVQGRIRSISPQPFSGRPDRAPRWSTSMTISLQSGRERFRGKQLLFPQATSCSASA